MSAKILSLGAIYLDINSHNFPFDDTGLLKEKEYVASEYALSPGGSAVNFALICRALDLSPIFIGKVGTDSLGGIVKSNLESLGVIPALIESDQVQTNLGINYANDTGETVMTVVGSANQSVSPEDVQKGFMDNVGQINYLYLGGCFKLKSLTDYYPEMAEVAKKNNVKVILDHGRVNNSVTDKDIDMVMKVISNVDYYLPSKEEFLRVWGAESLEEGFELVSKLSNAIVVVKDGGNGVVGWDGSNKIEVSSFPIKVIHTTGAGDSFNAGIIKAQSDGLNLEDSIRFGCATAAVNISKIGLPTLAEVITLLKS
jgi:ribokinase